MSVLWAALGCGGGKGNGGTAGNTGGGAAACAGHDIDVPVATVTGTVTVNGAPFSSTTESGHIAVRNASGDTATIADIGTGRYSARLVPGTYDIHYAFGGPSSSTLPTLPLNMDTRIRTGVVIPTGSSSLDIDVPVATVTGSLTFDGVAVSMSGYAHFFLREANTGLTTQLGSTLQSTYTARVIPGTYDVYYFLESASATLPVNGGARIRAGVVIPTGSSSLDIDVPTATVSGSFTLDGVAIPSSGDFGIIALRNETTGDFARLGYIEESTYTARVVPGTYDVYYNLRFAPAGSTLPVNSRARIRTGVVIPTGSASLDVDVPTATVTGSLTVDGAQVPSPTQFGTITLENAETADSAMIGHTGQGTYTAHLVPGTYDAYYNNPGTSSTPPITPRAKLRTGIVIPAGSSSLDIDLPIATVTGSLTVNGVAVTSTTDFIIYLREAISGKQGTILDTGQSAYTARLVPGTYDVYYTLATTSSTLPINRLARIRTGVVIPAGSSSLDIDVPVATKTGSFTVAGAAVPSTNVDGEITLRNATTGEMTILGYVTQGTYTARLVPGTYDVHYSSSGAPSATLPLNSQAKLRCFSVP